MINKRQRKHKNLSKHDCKSVQYLWMTKHFSRGNHYRVVLPAAPSLPGCGRIHPDGIQYDTHTLACPLHCWLSYSRSRNSSISAGLIAIFFFFRQELKCFSFMDSHTINWVVLSTWSWWVILSISGDIGARQHVGFSCDDFQSNVYKFITFV